MRERIEFEDIFWFSTPRAHDATFFQETKKRGASLSLSLTLHKKTRTKQHYSKHRKKMGFLGLGRKKKSEAELLEEERLRRQSLPWYARLFGTECCGNRGGKKEKKEEKKNNNGGA